MLVSTAKAAVPPRTSTTVASAGVWPAACPASARHIIDAIVMVVRTLSNRFIHTPRIEVIALPIRPAELRASDGEQRGDAVRCNSGRPLGRRQLERRDGERKGGKTEPGFGASEVSRRKPPSPARVVRRRAPGAAAEPNRLHRRARPRRPAGPAGSRRGPRGPRAARRGRTAGTARAPGGLPMPELEARLLRLLTSAGRGIPRQPGRNFWIGLFVGRFRHQLFDDSEEDIAGALLRI
jgi:hypothetical protein